MKDSALLIYSFSDIFVQLSRALNAKYFQAISVVARAYANERSKADMVNRLNVRHLQGSTLLEDYTASNRYRRIRNLDLIFLEVEVAPYDKETECHNSEPPPSRETQRNYIYIRQFVSICAIHLGRFYHTFRRMS